MCSLKPLAFCMHHNLKNIQKRPINSSRGKIWGNNHNFDTESFSTNIKFIRDHLQTRNINCSAVIPGSEVQDKSLFFFTFISQTFLPMVDANMFYVFISNPQNEQEICCLFIGSWHSGSCHKNDKFSAPVQAPCYSKRQTWFYIELWTTEPSSVFTTKGKIVLKYLPAYDLYAKSKIF